MYALESLDDSGLDSFVELITKIGSSNYLIFDCPGQVELFTHHSSFFRIFKQLERKSDARLCVISLIDSIHLVSPSQYISVLLLTLRSMIQLELPQINVISKIDKIKEYGDLPMRLEYYTEVQDLKFLFPEIEKESPTVLGKNFVRLTEMIAEIVEDYNLVSFEVLSVENKKSMIKLLSVIDKTNGYSYGSSEAGGDMIWSQAVRNGWLSGSADVDIQERWIDQKDLYDKLESNAVAEQEMEQEMEQQDDI